jgi:hypothetical protein
MQFPHTIRRGGSTVATVGELPAIVASAARVPAVNVTGMVSRETRLKPGTGNPGNPDENPDK